MREDKKVVMAKSNKPAAGKWRTDAPPKDGEWILGIFEGVPVVIAWDDSFDYWIMPFHFYRIDVTGELLDTITDEKIECWTEISMPDAQTEEGDDD